MSVSPFAFGLAVLPVFAQQEMPGVTSAMRHFEKITDMSTY